MEQYYLLILRGANYVIWAAFAYLTYWMICVLAASHAHRRRMLCEATEWHGLYDRARIKLNQWSKGTHNSVMRDVSSELRRITTSEIHSINAPQKMFVQMAEAISVKRLEIATLQLDTYHLRIEQPLESQRHLSTHAQRLGLLGTVAGVGQMFLEANGKAPPLASLGFALATTGVGLVLAAGFELAMFSVFQPAVEQLKEASAVIRDKLSLQVETVRREMERRPATPNETSSQDLSKLPDVVESTVSSPPMHTKSIACVAAE
jgi:biopolymer transport protein ExbB/TolQ